MKYSIFTGFYSDETDEKAKLFEDFWYPNTIKYCNKENGLLDIFVINSNGKVLPNKNKEYCKWVDLPYNPGHVHWLDGDVNFPKKFGGWSLAFLTGALIAYSSNVDYCFKEQDCVAFNGWIQYFYQELENFNSSMLVGRAQDSDGQGLEQSLFIIKHDFILPFITEYLSFNHNDAGNGYIRPEAKFRTIINTKFKDKVTDMKIGYGRSRPNGLFNKDEIFYLQKPRKEELFDLKNLGLID